MEQVEAEGVGPGLETCEGEAVFKIVEVSMSLVGHQHSGKRRKERQLGEEGSTRCAGRPPP